jgi:hypothetical protein
MKLPLIPIDKLKHFLYGTVISFVLININPYYGFGLAVLIFGAKEIIYDKLMKKGNCEFMDFVYGLIPAILLLITKTI